jgi:hypothetical protein
MLGFFCRFEPGSTLRILCFLLLIPNSILCQLNKAVKISCIPQIYILPEIDGNEDNILEISLGTKWEVISDRSENLTFTDYSGQIVKEKVKFLESYYVCNEVGDYLHIFSDSNPDLQKGILGKTTIDRGWIRKSTLLLWKHCLIEKSTKRNIQLLTFRHADIFTLGSPEQNGQNGIVVYNDPDLKVISKVRTQADQLYYIYKTSANAYLIGTNRRIPAGTDPREIIIGWIPINYSYRLDNRIWISPNMTTSAIEERNGLNVQPSLLMAENQAILFKETGDFDKKFLMWQLPQNQISSSCVCFPLVSEKNGVFKIKYVEDDFRTGYAPFTINGLQSPLFRRVTLMNTSELNHVILNMERLSIQAKDLENRDEIRKCLVNLLKGSDYSDFDEEIINNLTFREIFESLFWITTSTDPIMNYKLRKISDTTLMPDNALLPVLTNINRCLQELNKIANLQILECTFISNDIRYFFIDLNLLP